MTDTLALVPAGIDTYRQPVVYMNEDCHICRSEGFAAQTRVRIDLEDRWIIATLNVVGRGAWLDVDQAALSASAWAALGARAGDKGAFSHPEPPVSASMIRSKAYGDRLDQAGFAAIVSDTLDSRLSDLELAAFVTACAGERLDEPETVALTRAMQGAGQTLDWGGRTILDKHCVGGLPGNRTTPIVVAIIAAAGHLIPKTSSRAITSPAGTADTMEAMAPVALDAAALRRVVEAEGGCIVWGGGLALSPADDHFIRVERPLDFDSTGQLVASVLSKKAAAGATHVLIDMPVGPTAKVRSEKAAEALGVRVSAVSNALGLNLALHISDGIAPVGRGIGPTLEAIDVLAVLRRAPDAPADLRERALDLAGHLLDLAPDGVAGQGRDRARALLDSGAAEARFMAICEAQGGFREPGTAAQRIEIHAPHAGLLTSVDNRRIARIAKLAGAPRQKCAGIRLLVRLGDRVDEGQPLYELHAETAGELAYALAYAESQTGVLTLSEEGP
ncbi:thymidine phosphorylase [Roseivivax marinus]|jgi:thymidine phosphorylase|uniref:Putative thymidine phosphorylase n=4 Tax=Rhodobacterales TaxID=204455 RepID=W4HD15_9RHOB|nr:MULTISPECIES: thymidine phosphorylase family protein [Rhodobacterales]NKX75721.1 thymidine phosphorylase family protein [Rhodobacteraceae bacterium R_SAG3]ETW10687.1 thymidine phosphorylase [Roseivivax marinus]MBU3031611.1 thymidine phosphorylase family protein [Paracoccus marinaquae]WBU58637.1 thymidine phosphorylase family protein [Paracoccus sediminicola]WOI31141.1 thymidine phosphorylase family protein [Sulfitobacter dubius]